MYDKERIYDIYLSCKRSRLDKDGSSRCFVSMISLEPLVRKHDVGYGVCLQSRRTFALVKPNPLYALMIGQCWAPAFVQRILGIGPSVPLHVYRGSMQAVAVRGELL